MAPFPPDSKLGIYIHIPFCSHICPYCDFNTYSGQEELIPRYVRALERDLITRSATVENRDVTSIFFGGGTPSLLTPEQIAGLLSACRTHFDVASDAEISLEANPNNVDRAYFAGLLEAGVNRLSLGIQTANKKGLRVLGRQHEAIEAKGAFLAARKAGFDNVSLDLIFGWPGQTNEQWKFDLDSVLQWAGTGPDHLSLYSLIVEPGTPMADAVERGILSVLDEDATADLYEIAMKILVDAGYAHYEVANWARPLERMSRHNAIYWRNGNYLGIGAGAHETVAGRRTLSHLLPRTYVEAVESGQEPISNIEQLDPRVQIGETMMLGLRLLTEGVTDSEFLARHGVALDEMFGTTIKELVDIGLVERHPDRVVLTHRGLMLANDVCARFL